MAGTCIGHTRTHVRHPVHSAESTLATAPPAGSVSRARMLAAREAAACPLAIASSRNFGSWAAPRILPRPLRQGSAELYYGRVRGLIAHEFHTRAPGLGVFAFARPESSQI